MHGFHLKLDLPDEKGGTTRDSYSPVIPSQIRRRVYQNHEKKTWQTHDDRDAVRHPCDRVSRVGHRSNDRAAGPRCVYLYTIEGRREVTLPEMHGSHQFLSRHMLHYRSPRTINVYRSVLAS